MSIPLPKLIQGSAFPVCVCAYFLSIVWLFLTLWIVAHQSTLSMGFPRQEYWSGLPFPPGGYLPYPRIKLLRLLHCRWILHLLSHQGSRWHFHYQWIKFQIFQGNSRQPYYLMSLLFERKGNNPSWLRFISWRKRMPRTYGNSFSKHLKGIYHVHTAIICTWRWKQCDKLFLIQGWLSCPGKHLHFVPTFCGEKYIFSWRRLLHWQDYKNNFQVTFTKAWRFPREMYVKKPLIHPFNKY